MASIVVAGNTSGSITISAPDVSGSNTLTLPAATGTVIYANASGNLQANSGYGSVATGYLCRAWVNFNGTGTVAIRASSNVTSITDNATGNYTINFTNAMPDTNYAASAFGGYPAVVNGWIQISDTSAYFTTGLRLQCINTVGPSVSDFNYINVAIFR